MSPFSFRLSLTSYLTVRLIVPTVRPLLCLSQYPIWKGIGWQWNSGRGARKNGPVSQTSRRRTGGTYRRVVQQQGRAVRTTLEPKKRGNVRSFLVAGFLEIYLLARNASQVRFHPPAKEISKAYTRLANLLAWGFVYLVTGWRHNGAPEDYVAAKLIDTDSFSLSLSFGPTLVLLNARLVFCAVCLWSGTHTWVTDPERRLLIV